MSDLQCNTVIRSSNFELLRIVCMLLIICGHIIMVHEYNAFEGFSWYVKQLLYPFCAVAVNVFVLISGYFGINLNYKKLWRLNGMVTFYSALFLITMICIGIHKVSFKTDWMYLFPVITKRYWFITIYFALCFISPALNKLVEVLNEKSYKKVLIACFCIFVILPTVGFILNFPTITGDAGYGIISFIVLYLLGRYLRIFYKRQIKKQYYLIGYICSMLLCAVFQIIYSKILGFTFDSLLSYDTLFVFVGALCLFLYFKELNISSRVINQFAAPCLAVYVLHLHPLFLDYLKNNNVVSINDFQGLYYLLLLFIGPIVVYIICALIEMGRVGLVSIFKK